MISKKTLLLVITFILPFTVGTAIVAHWYLTSRAERDAMLPEIVKVPEFAFTTDRNVPFSRDNLVGKVSIVDFIFTECAGICLMMSTQMREFQDQLEKERNIQLISISVDPETDTPDVLRRYAEGYGALEDKWVFLTGNKDSIYALSREGFYLGLDIEGEDAIIHSQKFVLIDQNGVIRGYYDSEEEDAMKSLLRHARILAGKASS